MRADRRNRDGAPSRKCQEPRSDASVIGPFVAAGAVLAGFVFLGLRHARQGRERDRIATLLHGQTRILEMIAVGKPLPDVLAALSTMVERQVPGMLCSVFLLDDHGDNLRLGAAPSLPVDFNRSLADLMSSPEAENSDFAEHLAQTVIIEDIEKVLECGDFCQLMVRHDLHACWSTPIIGDGVGSSLTLGEASATADGYLSLTDWKRFGEVLDRDDYSGPGGTRKVLRHPRTEFAVLEVARGGMLRRGLGVRFADAAIVTNIGDDHLHDSKTRSVNGKPSAEELLRFREVSFGTATGTGGLLKKWGWR